MSAPTPNKFRSVIPAQTAPAQTPSDIDLLGEDIDILDSFSREPEPLDFIIPAGFLAGTVGIAFGAGASSKSFFSLQLGMSVAGGGDADILLLEPQKTGQVLYIGREDPPLVIRHRLHAMSKHLPINVQADIAANFRIKSSYGREFDVTKPVFRETLIKASEGKRLVIVDTLSRSHSFEENSNEQMVQLLAIFEDVARNSGAAILLDHHMNKGSGRDGATNQQSARGATALTDNARWGASLTKMSPDQAAKLCDPDDPGHAIDDAFDRYVMISLGVKPNYGPSTKGRWLRKEKGGVLVPVFLEPWDKPRGGDGESQVPSRAARKYKNKEQSGGFRPPRRGEANIMGPGAKEFDATVEALEFESRFADVPPVDPSRIPSTAKDDDDDWFK